MTLSTGRIIKILIFSILIAPSPATKITILNSGGIPLENVDFCKSSRIGEVTCKCGINTSKINVTIPQKDVLQLLIDGCHEIILSELAIYKRSINKLILRNAPIVRVKENGLKFPRFDHKVSLTIENIDDLDFEPESLSGEFEQIQITESHIRHFPGKAIYQMNADLVNLTRNTFKEIKSGKKLSLCSLAGFNTILISRKWSEEQHCQKL